MHTNDDKNIQTDKYGLISNVLILEVKDLFCNFKQILLIKDSKTVLRTVLKDGEMNYNPEMALVAISLCLETSIPISIAGSLKYLDKILLDHYI